MESGGILEVGVIGTYGPLVMGAWWGCGSTGENWDAGIFGRGALVIPGVVSPGGRSLSCSGIAAGLCHCAVGIVRPGTVVDCGNEVDGALPAETGGAPGVTGIEYAPGAIGDAFGGGC